MSKIILEEQAAPGTPGTGQVSTYPSTDGVLISIDDAGVSRGNSPLLMAEVATTSGVTVDITNIPSWAQKVTVQFVGVSANGTDPMILQLGDAGGIETTGYLGSAARCFSGTDADTYTTGFGVSGATAAAAVYHGAITLTLQNRTSNTWVASGVIARSDGAIIILSAGSKALSGTLDRVRLTTEGGTNSFDAGAMSLLVE